MHTSRASILKSIDTKNQDDKKAQYSTDEQYTEEKSSIVKKGSNVMIQNLEGALDIEFHELTNDLNLKNQRSDAKGSKHGKAKNRLNR